ncbi:MULTISPECIES: GNAT family N-acetyltransferase [Oxalobacteraceae]|uniref:N-acetyltransferase n=1 Tax=Herminiimonas contaminans TaxID=1111140 RepID=A0ABS0ETU3_9BURK|nr:MULTISPECIES: N-acetyltransferase [Oxalobacteraceae]MBF8177464.1 N-acetyltransferase [Herminiimonas contaminans]
MHIRPERADDTDAITAVTRAAFQDHPHSDQTEHLIIAALRATDALALSLLAEVDGQVVGHIAFSPVTISDGSTGWYGLGPISVLPGKQKLGIGTRLIETGLDLLRADQAQGCVVAGDAAYYQRFGFRHSDTLAYPELPAEYFLALPLQTNSAHGIVRYHPAFSAPA